VTRGDTDEDRCDHECDGARRENAAWASQERTSVSREAAAAFAAADRVRFDTSGDSITDAGAESRSSPTPE